MIIAHSTLGVDMSIHKVLELVNGNSSGGFGSFVGHCPIHGDKKKSLSIKDENGKILVKCHAGCRQEDLIKYFINNGISLSEKTSRNTDSDKIKSAKLVWQDSVCLNGSDLASAYLKNRGLNIENVPKSIKFNQNCYCSDVPKKSLPALLAKIQDINGVFKGVQRIYLDENGSKANIDSPKKILGESSSYFVKLEGELNNDTIHLVEGVETGLAIYSVFKETIICSLSAKNLSRISTDKTVKTIHIWADLDKSGTGEREARVAAEHFSSNGINVIIHLPKNIIPDSKKGIDFLDVFNEDPQIILTEKGMGQKYSADILPINSKKYHLPEVRQSYLPPIFYDWMKGESERLGVNLVMIAVPFFSTVGSLIGSRIGIQPKKNDFWTSYANLWGVIIAPPGAKKTAILNTSIKFLSNLEAQELKKSQEKLSNLKDEVDEIEIKLQSLDKNFKKAVNEGDEETKRLIKTERQVLKKKLKDLEVKARRFSTNSFSLEKLIDLLGDNKNGILVYRDEINGILESFKKKGQETTRQFLLEGWNGDCVFTYDILSRPTKIVDPNCLTLLGGIQPILVNKILQEMRTNFSDDGFLQRFQLIAFPNEDRTPGFVDKGTDEITQKQMSHLFKSIIDLDPYVFGTKKENSDVSIVKLDSKAYARFASYMDMNDLEVFNSDDNAYKSHISKFGKLLSGLIIIFHVLNNIENKQPRTYATEIEVDMAILWCDLFKEHAKKMYDLNSNVTSVSGICLAKKIIDGSVKNFDSLRTISRKGWKNLNSAKSVEEACFFLEQHNWLKVTENKPSNGRPSSSVEFHKNLLSHLYTNGENEKVFQK